jgi:glycosyltransferase 2 family protein
MNLQVTRRGGGGVIFLGKFLVSALLLTILFWHVDRLSLFHTIQVLPLKVFLGCASLYILGYLISTFRWQRLLLAEGIRLPFWRLTLVYFEAAFFNLFLPTLIGGDLIRGYTIYRITQGHDASVASILADRISGFAALVGIAVIALGLAYRQIRDPQVAGMILTVTIAFIVMITVLLHDRMKEGVSGLLRIVGLTRFQAKLRGMVEALQRYSRHRRALGQAIALSVLLQALIIVTYYLIAAGLNLGIPIAYFFLYVPLITFAAMLPISVAGLGVREGSAVYFFAKAGVGAAAALTMSLVWFSLTLVVSGLGGLAFLLDTHSAKGKQV